MAIWKTSPWLKVVIGTAIGFWLLCAALVWVRYTNFYPTYVSFDQGIFNQVFWNSLHGRFFESSLSSTESIAVMQDKAIPDVFYRRLAQHFTPALLVWLPFYAVWQSPLGLSLLQISIVTASGVLLYALARHYHSPEVSAFLAISFYGANAVLGPTLANFHDLCQIPLYVFGLFLALERRSWWVFSLLSILILAVREDAGVVLFSIGVYLTLSRRFPRIGLALCTISFGYMLVLTNVVMPLLSPDISRRFVVEQFGQYVDGQEASTLQVIWGILSNPFRLVRELVTPIDRTLGFVLGQWLPLAFIPALSPSAWMLTAFPLLANLMRQDVTALSLDLRYAMTLVPGLFYGAILWWKKHPDRFPKFRAVWISCMAIAFLTTLLHNPNRALSFVIPDSFQPWVYASLPNQSQRAQVMRSFLAQIPPDASVSATTHLIPHLSNRREVVRFPETRVRNDDNKVAWMDYILLDIGQLQQYQIAFDDDRHTLNRLLPVLDRLLANQRYGAIGFQEGILFLKRATPSNPQTLTDWTTYRETVKTVDDGL